ncbi:MAG: hypothetical protein JWN73_230 [Betaproteobacteria bacterium]|nr:hypothetical protein [Betaproteobacteria bacterium]
MAKSKQENTRGDDDPIALPGPERYQWFVAEVLRGGNIWMAESDEFTMVRADGDGTRLLPIWPSAAIAQACFSPEDIAAGFKPVARPIETWLERSTPALVKDRVRLAVFPNAAGSAPIVPPPFLLNDLLLAQEREAKVQGQKDNGEEGGRFGASLAIGLAADSQAALERFVSRVREGRTVWLLRGDDGIRICGSNESEEEDGEADEDDGITVFPVWSDRAYAKRCAQGDWRDSEPFPVTIEDFISSWLPGMHGNGERVGPNWNADLIGKEVMPLDLLEMLGGE